MSETTHPPEASAQPPQWTPADPAAVTPAPPRTPFHLRVIRIWWAIGVALACLVVGAGVGSLVTHLADGGSSPARFQRFQDFPGGGPGQFRQGGPGGLNGQNGFGGPNGQFQAPNGLTPPNPGS